MTTFIAELESALGADGVSTDLVDRIAYSRDAFPLALKAAQHGAAYALPDCIVFPRDTVDVATALRVARKHRLPIVPFGGGSSVVGGALPVRGGIVIDLKGMADVVELDSVSGLVTVGAGANGQRLEDHLNERGFTLGHYPQSLRSSTVGGWIAHRATGTASTRYGGIESLVAGLEVVLPNGTHLELPPVPRTAVGPDLRQLFLGAEGTLGIVTRATLRVRPLPQTHRWLAFTFTSFPAGLEAIRHTVQADLRPSVVRLYDEAEARPLLEAAERPPACLLIARFEGDPERVDWESTAASWRITQTGGLPITPEPAEDWWRDRFSTAALLRTLQTPLGLAETLEAAAPWRRLSDLYFAMREAIRDALASGGTLRAIYGHTSHAYTDGANVYLVFHGEARSEADLPHLYFRTLEAAFLACSRAGGTISHHHGVGLAKARWISLELGETGLEVLRAVQRALDPDGLFNPGKLGVDGHA